MDISQETLAHIRFGFGLSPDSPTGTTPDDLLAQLTPANIRDGQLSIATTKSRLGILHEFAQAKKRAKNGEASDQAAKAFRGKLRQLQVKDMVEVLSAPLASPHGFQERLVSFWADHFTVSGKNQRLAAVVASYRNEAIRPNISGSFGDLLVASATHPAMLNYLDQNTSFGPNSRFGKRTGRGLNENLAREILELHTLGVGSGYGQNDVREFAELLTGLQIDKNGLVFNDRLAEPGAETVLGKTYGGRGAAKLDDIIAALQDIALRPETADHITRKLAVHFIADDPDPDLVAQISAAYRATQGNLNAVYAAMLDHPAAWAPRLAKVKQPWDFVVSAFRAMGFSRDDISGLNRKDFIQGVVLPMTSMGQTPFRPPGPDGWPEDSEAWITPATLTARLDWVSELARTYAQEKDPREFLRTTLRDAASKKLTFVASGAVAKWEGVALVLASPEFNRR